MKNIAFILLSFVLFSACQDEIDIDLNSSDPKVVIEAEVTDQPGPYLVKLSKSVNFSESNNFPKISGATVSIADNNGFSEVLAETAPGEYSTSLLVGQYGKTYTLTVAYNGKTYTANSTMPQLVNLDSLRADAATFGPPGQNPNYFITPKYTDPVTVGNNYRFIQYKGGEDDKSFNVFNDNVNNGAINNRPVFSGGFDIKKFDTLTLEMQCIDKANYDYLYSLGESIGSGPGGGTTPANPVSNVSGGALGYFSAHTSQKLTIVVQ